MIKKLIFLLGCFSLNATEVAFLVLPGWSGEVSFAHHLKAACETLKWQGRIFNVGDPLPDNLNMVLQLVPGHYEKPNCKNYLALFHPQHHYFQKDGSLQKAYQHFDGYLTTYLPETPLPAPHLRWFPTVQQSDYQEVEPDYLFHLLCHWGNRCDDEKFRALFKRLDKAPYTRFYGKAFLQELYPKSYQGEVPYDADSLRIFASLAGVSLVLHSDEHNAQGLPSLRIFEAAAASTVIICDNNLFVRAHFGNAVLYIDTSKKSEAIFDQIDRHMKWIQKHKPKALQMAKKAHEIFTQKFLLEDQLLRWEAFSDAL